MDKEDELVNKIKDFMELQDEHLNVLEEYFELIKYRSITRIDEIEHLLDNILSIFQTDKTLDLYIRVCLYYHAIDKKAADDYANLYFERYEDDRVINEINKMEKEIEENGKSKSLFYQRDYFGRTN